MKVMTFKYMKSPADITDRVVLELAAPNDKYFCVDMGELNEEQQGLFVAGVMRAHEEYLECLNRQMEMYDIKHAFRFFKPEKMIDVKVDE